MAIVATEVWIPAPADPTRTYQVGAGVTPRASVQVTNNTQWNLFLNDSSVPPTDSQNAKYVVPPRATAQYPLEQAILSARWSGVISTASDLITFVFTDEVVAPAVWPGTSPSGAGSSPIQTLTLTGYDIPFLVTPLTLTTSSGLNIGAAFIHNHTRFTWRLQPFGSVANIVHIPPYSWASIPLNLASGSVQLWCSAPAGERVSGGDSMYFAWSDINYPLPFPAGAGELANPFDPARNPLVIGGTQADLTNESSQVFADLQSGFPGPTVLYTIPQNALLNIRWMTVSLFAPAAAGVLVVATRGYGGNNAIPNQNIFIGPMCGAGNSATTEYNGESGMFIRGNNVAAPNNTIVITPVGGGAGTIIWSSMHGTLLGV